MCVNNSLYIEKVLMPFIVYSGMSASFRNNYFKNVDRPIELNTIGSFDIAENTFINANEAIVLDNCKGKGSVKGNSTLNVNTLVKVTDSNNVLSSKTQNRKSQQKFEPIPESKKLAREMEIKYKRLIQKLLCLEAENKFLKNHKQVRLIKEVKSNFGTTRSHLLLKQLLHKALQ